MRLPKSLYWAAALPGVALLAGGLRWYLQGSGNVYTALSRRYYIPDPDLGWRVVHEGPLWLGLEVLAVIAAAAIAIVISARLVQRRERGLGRTWRAPRIGLFALSALPLIVPIAAFSSGFGPGEARDQLPASDGKRVAPAGVGGQLAGIPAGRYSVVAHEGSAVTAKIRAGGETFDTRFTGNIVGSLDIDTQDLGQPIQASVRVDAASVDTGIAMRSKHAREYLETEEFAQLTFTLGKVLAAEQGSSPAEIYFWAAGTIELIGKRHNLPVTGTIRALDEVGRQRLGLSRPGLVVSADLTLNLKETALAGDAGDFDQVEVPVHVALVMTLGPTDKPTP